MLVWVGALNHGAHKVLLKGATINGPTRGLKIEARDVWAYTRIFHRRSRLQTTTPCAVQGGDDKESATAQDLVRRFLAHFRTQTNRLPHDPDQCDVEEDVEEEKKQEVAGDDEENRSRNDILHYCCLRSRFRQPQRYDDHALHSEEDH